MNELVFEMTWSFSKFALLIQEEHMWTFFKMLYNDLS